jgi:2-iminobutanoate/2-iminopropanoate deaminase
MQPVSTPNAPPAIGPYSQAVKTNGLVFVAGQIGADAKGDFDSQSDIVSQTRQALKNLEAILVAAGSSKEKVVKTSVFLADMNDFKAMNEEYAQFFGANKPARATVQVAALPRGARIEIEAVALG